MYETIDPRAYETYRIQSVFRKEQSRVSLDARLIGDNVSAILVDSSGRVRIKLKNDQVVERGE